MGLCLCGRELYWDSDELLQQGDSLVLVGPLSRIKTDARWQIGPGSVLNQRGQPDLLCLLLDFDDYSLSHLVPGAQHDRRNQYNFLAVRILHYFAGSLLAQVSLLTSGSSSATDLDVEHACSISRTDPDGNSHHHPAHTVLETGVLGSRMSLNTTRLSMTSDTGLPLRGPGGSARGMQTGSNGEPIFDSYDYSMEHQNQSQTRRIHDPQHVHDDELLDVVDEDSEEDEGEDRDAQSRELVSPRTKQNSHGRDRR